jgi:hypothetical protein
VLSVPDLVASRGYEREFDCTKGYPGEGPGSPQQHSRCQDELHVRVRRRLHGKQAPPQGGQHKDQAAVENEKGLKISLFAAVGGAAHWLRVARERAIRNQPAKGCLSIYFANVTSWSQTARSYIEYEVRSDVMAFVETHLRGRDFTRWQNRVTKWGYRVSGRGQERVRHERGMFSCSLACSRLVCTWSCGPTRAVCYGRS